MSRIRSCCRIFLPIALFVLFSFAACSCGDDDDNEKSMSDDDTAYDDDSAVDDDSLDDDSGDDDTLPDVSDLIESGKDWLKIGEGDKARLDFMAALQISPTPSMTWTSSPSSMITSSPFWITVVPSNQIPTTSWTTSWTPL